MKLKPQSLLLLGVLIGTLTFALIHTSWNFCELEFKCDSTFLFCSDVWILNSLISGHILNFVTILVLSSYNHKVSWG